MTDPTIVGLLLSGLGVCSGVIIHLWKKLVTMQTALELKLKHCEDRHEVSDQTVLALSVKVAKIEGREEGINELAKAILERVKG